MIKQYEYLSNLCEQIRGVSYKPFECSAIPKENHFPIYRAHNIQNDGLNDNNLVYVLQDKIANYQYIKKGDIVICASSGSKDLVGKAAQSEKDCKYSFGAFCKVIRPNKKINSKYLGFYFKSSEYRSYISSISKGSNINNLRNEDFELIKIPFPPIEEQERIVKIIEKKLTAINKIGKTNIEQLINCNLLKDKIYRKIFEEYKNQKNVSLNDVANISAGGDKPNIFSKSKTVDNPIPVIANAIKNDGIIGYTNNPIIKKNSITVSARGTIGYSSIRSYPYYPIVRLISIIPDEDIIDINYLKFIFDILYEKGVGTSIPQLTIPMIVNKQIPLPSLNEQKNIVNLIKSKFNSIEKLKNVISEQAVYINALPSSILRKAFNGDY